MPPGTDLHAAPKTRTDFTRHHRYRGATRFAIGQRNFWKSGFFAERSDDLITELGAHSVAVPSPRTVVALLVATATGTVLRLRRVALVGRLKGAPEPAAGNPAWGPRRWR